jgi:hypothetical protein
LDNLEDSSFLLLLSEKQSSGDLTCSITESTKQEIDDDRLETESVVELVIILPMSPKTKEKIVGMRTCGEEERREDKFGDNPEVDTDEDIDDDLADTDDDVV